MIIAVTENGKAVTEMTPEEAIDFISNKIQIDVRFCSDDDINKTETALKLAVSALGKQIKKKPTCLYVNEIYKDGYCPECYEFIDDRFSHCKYCGQFIDWSDTE